MTVTITFDTKQPLAQIKRDLAQKYVKAILAENGLNMASAAKNMGISRQRMHQLVYMNGLTMRDIKEEAGLCRVSALNKEKGTTQ